MIKTPIIITSLLLSCTSLTYGASLRASIYDYAGGAAKYVVADGQHIICDLCPSTPPLEAAPPVIIISVNRPKPALTPEKETEPVSEEVKQAVKENDSPVEPVKVPASVITVHFRFDSAVLNKVEKAKIKAALSDKEKCLVVRVDGHTCKTGDKDYNKRLSVRRAKAVAKYLASQGIEVKGVDGYGSGKTLGGKKSMDRRAEIVYGGGK